jgi:DNA polymerase-3 subunit gamma/tau
VWSEVRAKVRERSRTVEVMLSGATVRAVDGDRLILSHASAPLAKRLVEPRNAEVIRDAMREVFGLDWAVDCEVGTAEPAEQSRAQAPRQQAKSTGGPRFSRPSQGNAAQTAPSAPPPAPEARPGPEPAPGPPVDDIPPPDYPDYPDDPGPPPPVEPAAPDSVTAEDEEEMMAQAAQPSDPSVRRDPEEMAIELLATELGAKRIDG